MNWRDYVKPEAKTKPARRFDLAIQILIAISLIAYATETLPDLPYWVRTALFFLEVLLVGSFTVEYVMRLAVAPKKRAFIFSFYGLIDLVAFLPFYIAWVDMRFLRIFRLFQLFRVLKLARYHRALDRFVEAFRDIREELVLYVMATGFLLFLASIGIYHFEHEAQPEAYKSVFHSLWWAVITFTTVGYGDVYPVTAGGRLFTFLLLMIGLGVIAVPSGLIASALTKATSHNEEK